MSRKAKPTPRQSSVSLLHALRLFERPPAEIVPPKADGIRFARMGAERSSGCSSPAAWCAEHGDAEGRG